MTQVEQFTNGKSWNLTGALGSGDATVAPPSYSGFPTSGQFRLKIDAEILLVTDASTHPFPISRGEESTTPTSHLAGAVATQLLTAGALANLIAAQQDGVLTATGQVINFANGLEVSQVGDVIEVDGGGDAKIGAVIQPTTPLTALAGTNLYLPLDDMSATQVILHGIVVNPMNNTRLIVPIDGRYQITLSVTANQHATDWTSLGVYCQPSNNSFTLIPVPPTSVYDATGDGFAVTLVDIVELTTGDQPSFQVYSPAADLVVTSAVCGCQYIGPSTGVT